MEADEQLYEVAAKELATSPRQELLIKCMTKAGGDEARGKAKYIEIRVKEMKAQRDAWGALVIFVLILFLVFYLLPLLIG